MDIAFLLKLLIRIPEFVLAFGLLVFLHELGHYLASKFFNIDVEEFGFGLPPRMVKLFQFRETEFTLNWLPFGAFVRPKGETDPSVVGGMGAASPFARLTVLFAGPFFNLVTGVLLFTLLYGIYGVPDPSRVLIDSVVEGAPAQAAGLLSGDIILKIEGQEMHSSASLQKAVAANLGKEITITYERSGQEFETRVTPRVKPPEGQGPLGIVMGLFFRKVSASEWLPNALQTSYEQITGVLTLPVKIIQGQLSPQEGRVVGPVGIFNIFDAAREQDNLMAQESNQPAGINTLSLLASLSIALGISNLLPIPALDGGRILFLLPEIVLRRRIPARYENLVHLVGLAALIILMVYITTQDIVNPIDLR